MSVEVGNPGATKAPVPSNTRSVSFFTNFEKASLSPCNMLTKTSCIFSANVLPHSTPTADACVASHCVLKTPARGRPERHEPPPWETMWTMRRCGRQRNDDDDSDTMVINGDAMSFHMRSHTPLAESTCTPTLAHSAMHTATTEITPRQRRHLTPRC